MKVLVQQQIWIAHEFLTVNREQNPVRPSRRTHAQVNPRISRVLDDDDSTHRLSEYLLERPCHWWRQHITAADQHAFITGTGVLASVSNYLLPMSANHRSLICTIRLRLVSLPRRSTALTAQIQRR